MGGIALIELVKDPTARFLRHTAARIGNLDHDGVFLRRLTQNNRTAISRKFEGIGQQIGPYQLHQALIGPNGDPVVQLGFKCDSLFLPHALELEGTFAQLQAQVVPLRLRYLHFWNLEC